MDSVAERCGKSHSSLFLPLHPYTISSKNNSRAWRWPWMQVNECWERKNTRKGGASSLNLKSSGWIGFVLCGGARLQPQVQAHTDGRMRHGREKVEKGGLKNGRGTTNKMSAGGRPD
jgi:hypothetical protein